MKLPGRLRATTLGDLLGVLHRGRATGILELIETAGVTAGRRHRLHLDVGLVQKVDTPLRVSRVGEILSGEGFLGAQATRRLARLLVQEPTKRTGQLLIEEELASSVQVAAALRHQLRFQLEAVFSLEDAQVRFHVARPRRRHDGLRGTLSPREFLHGRARARDRRVGQATAAPKPSSPNALLSDEVKRQRALRVLGLGGRADQKTVQQAFRRLAAKMHPDRHPGASPQQMATLMRGFAELTAAYHQLR